MSNNEMMILGNQEVPEYIKREFAAAAQANIDAMAGISDGQPPSVRLSGKQFVMVDAAGVETTFPPKALLENKAGQYCLPAIILRAKEKFSKAFYINPYKKDVVASPDCYSLDAVRPDPMSPAPQSDTCASCPNNAFGSGKDNAGNPTKGKACSDNKILAVYINGFGVKQLKLPPTSLRNLKAYVQTLTAHGIPMARAITLIGFDPTADHPVLTFDFYQWIPEKAIPKINELAASPEAEAIANPGKVFLPSDAPSPKAVAAGPSAEEVKAKAAAEKKAKEKAEMAAKVEADRLAREAAAAKVEDDVLGLGLGDLGVTEEVKAPVKQAASTSSPSDDELAKSLGLI